MLSLENILKYPMDIPELPSLNSFAETLARYIPWGNVLFLEGDLGTGKTTFARAFIQALLDKPHPIPSPTFPLICPYETPFGPLWHVDLYRLSPEDIETLGLFESWSERLTLIEWPDRLGAQEQGIWEPLSLNFTLKAQHRRLELKNLPPWASAPLKRLR